MDDTAGLAAKYIPPSLPSFRRQHGPNSFDSIWTRWATSDRLPFSAKEPQKSGPSRRRAAERSFSPCTVSVQREAGASARWRLTQCDEPLGRRPGRHVCRVCSSYAATNSARPDGLRVEVRASPVCRHSWRNLVSLQQDVAWDCSVSWWRGVLVAVWERGGVRLGNIAISDR